MTCTKTDFRMYQPLQGQPEEICWTCGVGKDKHQSEPISGCPLSAARSANNTANFPSDEPSPMFGLKAWSPFAPHAPNRFNVGDIVEDKKFGGTFLILSIDYTTRAYHYRDVNDPSQLTQVVSFLQAHLFVTKVSP